MTERLRLRGLYAITSDTVCEAEPRLLAAASAAIRGGTRLLQYRDKRATAAQRRQRAQRLVRCCREAGVPLIVNDDAELARAVGAAGVHLGRADGSVRAARRQLGPDAIIGASCSASLRRALAAVDEGASYVAFGRFFASRTKPDAPPASLELLDEARAVLSVPICVIGGMTPGNAGELVTRGADLIAAVEGVFSAEDVTAAARAYQRLFTD